MLARIQLLDITAARVCLDPSLPSGHAFWLGLEGHPSGVYYVAGASLTPSEPAQPALEFGCLSVKALPHVFVVVTAIHGRSRLIISPSMPAENEDDAEGWVDALLLCANLAAVKQLPALRQALNPPAKKQPPPLRKQDSARR